MDIPESATCKYLLSFVTADTHILVENISPLAAVYTMEYNRENCKEQVILLGFTSAFSSSLCPPSLAPPFRVSEGEKERMIFLAEREREGKREREIYKSHQINRRADKLGRVARSPFDTCDNPEASNQIKVSRIFCIFSICFSLFLFSSLLERVCNVEFCCNGDF